MNARQVKDFTRTKEAIDWNPQFLEPVHNLFGGISTNIDKNQAWKKCLDNWKKLIAI